jgi:hypothetical protein
LRLRVRGALKDRRADRFIERVVGEIGEQPGHALEGEFSAKIAERNSKRECVSLSPEPRIDGVPFTGKRKVRRGGSPPRPESVRDLSARQDSFAKEGRMIARAAKRVVPAAPGGISTHRVLFTISRPIPTKLPSHIARLQWR